MRRIRLVCSAALTGALMVGVSWAATGLVPVGGVSSEALRDKGSLVGAGVSPNRTISSDAGVMDLGADELLAGAAKVDIAPRPDDYGGVWQTEGCVTGASLDEAGDTRLPWTESPNCIYTGGYGIGPSNWVHSFDETFGLWSRSVALSDGEDTLVLTILDGTSYFGSYGGRLCEDCGAFDLADELGAELEIDPAGLVFASTHSHTAPDFIGGWGGVPNWYMEQVADAMRTSVRDAVANMRPAVLEAGEELAREHNRERRDTYRSAEEQAMSWFRAVDSATGETIATSATYAAHPTTLPTDGIAKADWPVLFNHRVEERFGGTGLLFMSGLGNMSAAGGTAVGTRLADLVPDLGGGRLIAAPDVRVAQRFWNQPATNAALDALGGAGGFDRAIAPEPGSVSVGKSSNKPCTSGSPLSVRTAVKAAKVGGLTVTAAPGETFSNLSNTIKEQSALPTLPIAQANDGLGYIMQSFEYDPAAGQALGFVGADFFEYEDAYAIDRCFGDMVLETTLELLGQL